MCNEMANNELLGWPVIHCNEETIEMLFETKNEFQGLFKFHLCSPRKCSRQTATTALQLSLLTTRWMLEEQTQRHRFIAVSLPCEVNCSDTEEVEIRSFELCLNNQIKLQGHGEIRRRMLKPVAVVTVWTSRIWWYPRKKNRFSNAW